MRLRTPSKEHKDGYYHAVVFTSRTDLTMRGVVELLVQLAHNILMWARSWLSQHAPRLHEYGIVRLIRQVWAIPGRVKLTDKEGVVRVRLRREHPRARNVCQGFLPLLAQRQTLVVLG